MSRFERSQETGDVAWSVGDAFEKNMIYSTEHPRYQAFSEEVDTVLRGISDREAVRKTSVHRVLVTESVDSVMIASMEKLFPEFSMRVLPLNTPSHLYWVVSRRLANEWLAQNMSKYAQTRVHFGGGFVSALLNNDETVHVESSAKSAVLVHECHSDIVDVCRIFQDFSNARLNLGVDLQRSAYDKFIRGKGFGVCTSGGTCTHKAEGLCVDLTQISVAPSQVAMAMLQHGATVANGFFIYHPTMLINDGGEIPGTGVYYKKGDYGLQFQYPEGGAGVSGYSGQVWAAWLASHCFSVGTTGKSWFQLELLKNRGHLMFFRMVQVDDPGRLSITHALDLEMDEPMTLFKSWRLKSLAKDPSKVQSWKRHNFLLSTRLVNRVKEMAMQLPQASFSRFAVRRQIRIVNDRWVVAGTTVSVKASADPRDIDDATLAIHARAFIDRYESSQLSAEMMKALSGLSKFGSYSITDRVRALSWHLLRNSYGYGAYESVNNYVRDTADAMVRWLKSSPKLAIELLPAPEYVVLTTETGGWQGNFNNHGRAFYTATMHGGTFDVEEHVLASNLCSAVASRVREVAGTAQNAGFVRAVKVATDFSDTRVNTNSEIGNDYVSAVAELNELDAETERRHVMEFELAQREEDYSVAWSKTVDPDPVGTLSAAYATLFPEVSATSLEFDPHSLSLDPQDRVLAAPYLRMGKYFGLPPATKLYYRSKLVALNIPKRQNTAQELLSAVAARNLAAPSIDVPQERDIVIMDIWENFLTNWCVPESKAKLAAYRADPIALGEDALKDWASKADPAKMASVQRALKEASESLGDMRVEDYLVMIKSDMKPTLSAKPYKTLSAPQVIVYHDSLLNSLFSSLFRVLVRRFLSLLKPNTHVNLLKDMKDIRAFVQAQHPFGEKSLKYLENDFSKYDKSQGEFAFALEEYVFRELGMNEEMLSKWVGGHIECNLRSVSMGLSLQVMYQRKSGDATTAFGNVLLNILSVSYAYRGTDVVWACFMGDDSLVCARYVAAERRSVRVMAEVFNLSAKNYVTDAPYYASNFFIIDDENETVKVVPDPVKKMERLSMFVSGEDPQWDERFESYKDALEPYTHLEATTGLAKCVTQRYELSQGMAEASAGALSTLATSFKHFRSVWATEPEQLFA